jgi:hypothetical protein
METQRRFECWLHAVVHEARTLGELAYRRSLIQDELTTLELRTKTELKWIKKAESAGPTSDAEHFREANNYLVQARYRSEQELEKLGRLIVAFQEDLAESINVLTENVQVKPEYK